MEPTTAQKEARTRSPYKKNGIVVGGERKLLVRLCPNCATLNREEIGSVVMHGQDIKVYYCG